MPLPPANCDPSIVLVACAWGWYRGPDGQCYPLGMRPGYYGGGGYQRDYYEHYRPPYRRYPYYGRPHEYDEDDES
jgi:hypothetical protein